MNNKSDNKQQRISFISRLKRLLNIKDKPENEGNYTQMHLNDQTKYYYDPIKKRYIIEG